MEMRQVVCSRCERAATTLANNPRHTPQYLDRFFCLRIPTKTISQADAVESIELVIPS